MLDTNTTDISIQKAEILQAAIHSPYAVKAERCRRSFFHFMQEFWDTVSNDDPQWNWHMKYLCDEMQKVAERVFEGQPKLYDLIINVPPGTSKSTICVIMFPVWCWIKKHWMKFIATSYSAALSLEHADYSRELIRSDKFQKIFPEIQIRKDKDQKGNFQIQKVMYDKDTGEEVGAVFGGNRFSTSVGAVLTGFHGHILLVDDPLNPEKSFSDVELKTSNRWIDQTLSMRKIDKAICPTIMIMQRLHQDDPTGHLITKKNKRIKHICLPGEIRTKGSEKKVSPPALKKYYTDGLLDPRRMDASVLKEMEADLGQYGYAGQVGQDPSPPKGGMFKVDRFVIIDRMPAAEHLGLVVRYWDKAGTEDDGAFTSGSKMWKLVGDEYEGKFLVSNVRKGQWSSEVREKNIKSTTEADGKDCVVWIEQEPGSGGKESAESTVRNLAGFSVRKDKVTGSKVKRADTYSVQVNDGNVLLLNGPWVQEFIDNHRFFPFGKYKDDIDSTSGAFNALTSSGKVFVS